MTNALETANLGKRYGRTWALRECALKLPTGKVAALVGPNGAGKTTLLHLAVGLLRPSAGEIHVFGRDPRALPLEVLPRVGFVAQDTPLYRGFSVTDLLTYGRRMNSVWDQQAAVDRLTSLDIPLDRQVGRLSGGQRAQVALALALAKRPDLLLLDEPLATLDPLARHEFLRALIQATSEHGVTVLLSSHILSDLERVCDHLIILSTARVQLAGDISEIVRSHKRLVGSRAASAAIAGVGYIVERRDTERQTMLLARVGDRALDPSWQTHDVSLEDIVLAYLSQSRSESASGWRNREEPIGAKRGSARQNGPLAPVIEFPHPPNDAPGESDATWKEADR
jgi:ABC-2 type transport system ATP-binding protein